MRKLTLLLPLLFVALFGSGGTLLAQKHTISGYITDAESGEKLISAKILDPVKKAGAISNAYGFFSLTLPEDTVRLVASYVGYQPFATGFYLDRDTTIEVKLIPEGVTTETVEITAEEIETIQESSSMSTIEVPVEQIKKLPSLLGEPDVIKAIQLLPGVQSGSEGLSGLYVRGGGPDQNLVLLDGVPVYNASHLFGFFSVFNPDAIRRVNLIKGGFPARYGGRLSSVLDISMKEGNQEEFHGAAQIGLLSAKATVEAPIIKDKTSFLLSARRTYFDVFTAPLIALADNGNTGGYYFYDINAKVNHKFSDKDRLYLSVYNGDDRFYIRTRDEYDYTDPSGLVITQEDKIRSKLGWGNTIAALRWNHVFSPKLFGNFTLTYSKYKFGIGASNETTLSFQDSTQFENYEFDYSSGIRDYSLRIDLDHYANPNHLLRYGGYATHHRFNPGQFNLGIDIPGFSLDTTIGNADVDAWEFAAYVEDDIKIGDRLKTNVGLHLSGMEVDGEFYPSIQPRFSGRFLLNDNWAIKASYAAMQQYIHLLTNSSVGLPTDLWLPATSRVKPQFSHQGAIGVGRTFKEQGVDFTVEAYYKHMSNVLEYKPGAVFFSIDAGWEDLVTQGNGWSYGMEVLAQKKRGKLTGWVGYTLSWTNRQFDDLNNGEVYPYKYDRRHDLSIVSNYQITDNIDVSATFVFGTGNALTIPVARYTAEDPQIGQTFRSFFPAQYYGSRNGYRMRPYHRMDLGANFTKERKLWTRTWNISVYNAYNRLNPYLVYFGTNINGNREFRQLSIFPVIPSVSYRIEW